MESLDKNYWGKPEYDSYLVITCHKLRKKQLKDFETEDLRIMIGQSIGLKYLIPLALKILSDNILAEGDIYEGDLLEAVLTSEKDYWKTEIDNWKQVCLLFNENRSLFETDNTKRHIRKVYNEFEKIITE